MDNRDNRVDAQVTVRVWGMDAEGRPFFQNASAENLSDDGALLIGIRHPLKVGDIIGIQYNDRKSRFKIVWVKDALLPGTVNAGVQILANQRSPWEGLATSGDYPAATGQNKRRFQRHKVLFPIEIRFQDSRRSHIHTNATDIGGRGCYVETLLPLSSGTKVTLVFWVDSEKIQTVGVVRTSDPGVGMGIEFMELDNAVQEWLQAHLDKLDASVSGETAKGASSQ
ncbi:MAG TPA: PilZ domain-containing protein [Terriglobales bacterium]|nr:PilZ domain-containing protein [Terriglobales bacterium]